MASPMVPSSALRFFLASSSQVGTRPMMLKASVSTPFSKRRRTAAIGAVKGVPAKNPFLPIMMLRSFWWTFTNYVLLAI